MYDYVVRSDTPSEVGGFMAKGGGSHTLPTVLRATVGLTYLGLAVAGRASSLSTTSTANYYLLQALVASRCMEVAGDSVGPKAQAKGHLLLLCACWG